MRTAIIADIHGDYPRLTDALADIGECRCDRIICLGDLVNGGDGDGEVVEEIRRRNIVSVRGNHDEYTLLFLPRHMSDYLSGLPDDLVEGDVLYTHISPRRKKYYIRNEVEAWNAFDESKYRLVFIGHNHFPVIFGEKAEEPVSATRHEITYNQPYGLDLADRYIICVGAVGYSRDFLPNVRYGIYDNDANTIEIRLI